MIRVVEKDRKNEKLLAMENVDKITKAEVAKVLNLIDLGSKHSWAICNVDMDAARNLGLIGIKKY